MKKCIDCNQEKDESEFWKKLSKLVSYCKDCGKIRNKKNHEKNKDEKNKKQKQKYYENREQRLLGMKKNYEEHKEERLQYAKNKRLEIKEEIQLNGLNLPDIKEKLCTTCKEVKSIDMFYIKKTQNKYFEKCKDCKIIEARLYRKENREKINIYMRKYIKSDKAINRRIHTNLRKRLGTAIKTINTGKTKLKNKLMGCSKELLLKWFEYNLEIENIKLKEYGDIWHIDHVIPCDAFDLEKESEQQICFHWSNIRPLDKFRNLYKSNHILLPDLFVQEIRLKIFIKLNHIDEHVLDTWKNGVLNTTVLVKTKMQ